MNHEDPFTVEDKERVTLVKQIQECKLKKNSHIFVCLAIAKRGNEDRATSPEGEAEIEQLLYGYVATCHNASMEFMKTNQ